MKRTLSIPWTLVLSALAFACLARSAHAALQEPIPAAGFDRDVQLVETLIHRGEWRQAEWIVSQWKKRAATTDAQKETLAFLDASLRIEAFDAESDFDAARARYADLRPKLEAAMRPGSAVPLERALEPLARLDRWFGLKVVRQLDLELSAERIEALRQIGDEAFKNAEAHLDQRAAILRTDLGGKRLDSPEERLLLETTFAKAEIVREHSWVFEDGSTRRSQMLLGAMELYDAFTLDCPADVDLFAEAHRRWSDGSDELYLPWPAKESLHSYCYALCEWNARDVSHSKAPANVSAHDARTGIRAASQLLEVYTTQHRFDEVIRIAADVEHSVPDFTRYAGAFEILDALLVAYDETFQREKAIDTAHRICRLAPPNTRFHRRALELLRAKGVAVEDSQPAPDAPAPQPRMDWIQTLKDLLSSEGILNAIKVGGPWLLFLIVFVETGLLIGFFLPGDSLLVTAGLFAADPANGLNIWFLLLILSVAAITGDALGFWIGSKAGPALFKRDDSLLFKRKHLLRAHAFYERYGGKTIVLARFVPIVRTFAPTVAGAAGMDYRRFAMFNVLGGIGWVGSMLLTGWLVFTIGEKIGGKEAVTRNLHYIIGVVIFLSILPAIIEIWRERRRAKREGTGAAK